MRPVLFLSFISLSFSAFGQMPKETVDTKAKGILDELSAKTKTYTSIKAEFSSVVENKDKKATENVTGSLQTKGNKYKLEFKGQTIISDGKTQWTYIKESNEVQINNAPDPNSTDNINPLNIFTIYEKGFKFKYDKEDVVNGAAVHIINLYPLDPGKKNYHTVKLTIDKAKKQIIGVKIMMKNGGTNTITLKSFTPNAEMPEADFSFNKANYKGVEVIDLREDDK